MTIWFDKPNKAFHAYEQSLLRPIARPAPRDAPSLWQRAKEMFGVVMQSAHALMQRLTRAERREIKARLKPVEKLTRELLVTEAATLLLMTPEGMKLRREARIMSLPVKKPPPPRGALVTSVHTIRIPGVYIPPAPPRATPATTYDANDPKTWRCTFNVIRLVHPEDEDARPAKIARPRPRMISYEDIIAFTPKPARQQTRADNDPDATLARRIEALSRVLDKPQRALRRVARFLASLPREALDPPDPTWIDTRGWYHGHTETRAASNLCDRVLTLLYRLRLIDFDGPAPEPG